MIKATHNRLDLPVVVDGDGLKIARVASKQQLKLQRRERRKPTPYTPAPRDASGNLRRGVVTTVQDCVYVEDDMLARVLAWQVHDAAFNGIVVTTAQEAVDLLPSLKHNAWIFQLDKLKVHDAPNVWWAHGAFPTACFVSDPSIVQLPPALEHVRYCCWTCVVDDLVRFGQGFTHF